MTVVADSSPLIGLAAIGRLELVEESFGPVVIPPAVVKELTVKDKPFVGALGSFLADRVRPIKNQFALELLLNQVGRGEAEAILLAAETPGSIVLIDDRKARRVARTQQLRVVGTLARGVEFGRPKLQKPEKFNHYIKLVDEGGLSPSEAMKALGLKKTSYYKLLSASRAP